jgi:hypothetical protein
VGLRNLRAAKVQRLAAQVVPVTLLQRQVALVLQ